MEPPRARTHTPALTYSQRLWRPRPHTHWFTHSRTHLKSKACWRAQSGGGGISFFFFLSFCFFNLLFPVCFLYTEGHWERVGEGCNTSTALQRALAHHCISDDTVEAYRACRSHWFRRATEAATKQWYQDKTSNKREKWLHIRVHLCAVGLNKNTVRRLRVSMTVRIEKDLDFRGLDGLLQLLCCVIAVGRAR